ncbi:MAG: hypothetical protein H6595_10850 [Flavobacteriales bacterium]|nr:hypothetical protein [Flavobacteriales bacterium]MCB9167960.1 hypothetical protein [Flavobacteriales bacterium]
MPKRRFSDEDLEELLSHYRSERRKLIFQLDEIRRTIKQLRGSKTSDARTSGRRTSSATGTTRRRGRKPGRKKKRTVKDGGYRLNDWDNAVVSAIKTTGRLLPKADLLVHLKKWAAKNEPKVRAAEIDAHLTRSLQKLSGKRGVLGKHHTGLRRGFHYGLKEWFFNTSGKLRRTHLHRLVLSTKD